VEEKPAVDVWHWRDIEVMAYQSKNANQESHRNMLALWNLNSGTLTQLGQSDTERVTPFHRGELAVVSEWNQWGLENSIGRPLTNIYVADANTGKRTMLKEKLGGDRGLESSPNGKYVLFPDGDHISVVDVKTGIAADIGKNIKTPLIDIESDSTSPERPIYGSPAGPRTTRKSSFMTSTIYGR